MRTLLLCSTLLLPGCGTSELAQRRFDTPALRFLQNESVAGLPQRPVNGQSIEAFFKNKVALIKTRNGQLPSGRAVPLSRDGYFVTAWHVVSEDGFHLSNTVMLKQPPKDRSFRFNEYFLTREHYGRVVWHDTGLDLAIVHFDYRPDQVFVPAPSMAGKGTRVFSGAGGRNGGELFSQDLSDGVGNGPFQTAGKITRAAARQKAPPGWVSESTLIGRGGMSGAPVVDENGRLLGVITHGKAGWIGTVKTLFSMIEPATLDAIVANDRHRGAPVDNARNGRRNAD